MSSSSVLSDDSRLSRLDRAALRIEGTLNLIGGITIIMLVLMAVWNVVGRKLFNAPVPGYVDWTEQFMILFAFFGLAYCQREGGHIRMDIVVMRLRGRLLWAFEWLSILFMLLVTTALIYGSWHHFLRSFDLDMALFSRDSLHRHRPAAVARQAGRAGRLHTPVAAPRPSTLGLWPRVPRRQPLTRRRAFAGGSDVGRLA
jgi:TRAP-type C4-dicarboxylate transport system permease small subunit